MNSDKSKVPHMLRDFLRAEKPAAKKIGHSAAILFLHGPSLAFGISVLRLQRASIDAEMKERRFNGNG
jgi:hypothetical protein